MQRKLLKHMQRHSGDKPYCCQTCGKCFAGSGDLQRHVRSHTGERPYVCDTCGKGFTRTAVLRRHHANAGDANAGDANAGDANAGDANALVQQHNPEVSKATASPTTPPSCRNRAQLRPLPSSTPPPAGTCRPLRSVLPQNLLAPPTFNKPLLTHQKAPPPHVKSTLNTDPSAGSALRPHLLTPEAHCSPPLAPVSSQTHSAPYRSSEGFCSSGALWGLAMKTLQSDSDMDQ
uniref:Zinc finger and BTB domain containing 49 n=1 Tax=Astyanax mexicanus TaxID=7994 RepID=A0A3B1J8G3_ASTMX